MTRRHADSVRSLLASALLYLHAAHPSIELGEVDFVSPRGVRPGHTSACKLANIPCVLSSWPPCAPATKLPRLRDSSHGASARRGAGAAPAQRRRRCDLLRAVGRERQRLHGQRRLSRAERGAEHRAPRRRRCGRRQAGLPADGEHAAHQGLGPRPRGGRARGAGRGHVAAARGASARLGDERPAGARAAQGRDALALAAVCRAHGDKSVHGRRDGRAADAGRPARAAARARQPAPTAPVRRPARRQAGVHALVGRADGRRGRGRAAPVRAAAARARERPAAPAAAAHALARLPDCRRHAVRAGAAQQRPAPPARERAGLCAPRERRAAHFQLAAAV